MDDDHHEKHDGDGVIMVIVETPKQLSVDDEDTSQRRCHYGQPIKAICVEKNKKAYKNDTACDKVQTWVCVVVVIVDRNNCMGVRRRVSPCVTVVGRFASIMRLWKCGR